MKQEIKGQPVTVLAKVFRRAGNELVHDKESLVTSAATPLLAGTAELSVLNFCCWSGPIVVERRPGSKFPFIRSPGMSAGEARFALCRTRIASH